MYLVSLLAKVYLSCAAVLQVEIACPGFMDPHGGNGALAYHVPAYEAAVNDSNSLYKGIFNFSLTLIMGDPRKITTTVAMQDNAADLLAKWYFHDRRDGPDHVSAIITPGRYAK